MDEHQIQITRASQESALGSHSVSRPEVLPDWPGLRLVRYRPPSDFKDRHILAVHPILTLLCEGDISSHMRVGLRDMRSQVRANELMFYSGGKEIDYTHMQSRGATLISLELDPSRLSIFEPGEHCPADSSLQGEPSFSDPELGNVVRSLWQEGRAGSPQGRLFADSLSLGLAMRVYRRFSKRHTERNDAGTRLTSSQLRRIDDYIAHHLDQSIGLDDLAQAVGLSRFHFSRVFSNTLGHSPYQHVIRKRLERGYQLLMSSEMSVADVALSAGFSSQAHFSTLCRRELGATPRTLRQRRS